MKAAIERLVWDGYILVFNQDKLDIVKTGQALLKAGIGNMEVTCRIRKPLEKIQRLRKELPDLLVGAASLVDFPEVLKIYNQSHREDPLPTVDQVVQAGAGYLVSAANFSNRTYQKYGGKLPIIPGCGSVTEIVDQFSLGASFCKIFPAKELGGPGFVQAIDPAIHKFISLIPTGGTNMDNIPDYIAAGILVLGGSFSMIEKTILNRVLDNQDYDLLAEQFKQIKNKIDELRQKQWPGLDLQSASLEEISKATGRCFHG